MSQEVTISDELITDYRRQSASYAEIAAEAGITVAEAVAIIKEYVNSAATDDPETIRRLDIERIELGLEGIVQQASAGDYEAIRTMLLLMDRRQRLEAKQTPSIAEMFRQG
jgi:hypothetical protein